MHFRRRILIDYLLSKLNIQWKQYILSNSMNNWVVMHMLIDFLLSYKLTGHMLRLSRYNIQNWCNLIHLWIRHINRKFHYLKLGKFSHKKHTYQHFVSLYSIYKYLQCLMHKFWLLKVIQKMHFHRRYLINYICIINKCFIEILLLHKCM